MPDDIPLLSAKLFLPPLRPALVRRERLTARLAAGLAYPLTLVSAPAGSGKSTLLGDWRASERGRSPSLAWLALDADDNDPVRFLTYLIAAVATARPGFGERPLAWLRSPGPQPPAVSNILGHLIGELDDLDNPLALVLDDYHLITARPVHDGLAYLLNHMPAQLRLVILTRADPPLPLARLRARGQLTEIRAADLRFTFEEASAFLNQVMGLSLSLAEVEALEARTEGWIAGLQLAALSMKGREDTSGFVRSFTGSHAYVAEYLVEEVLQRQPEAVQTFLLHTSILERLSGPLCEALLGSGETTPAGGRPAVPPRSAFVLEELERANLFVTALDDRREWYRYHHLFADLLQARLVRALPAKSIAALHQRASAWFAQGGFVAEAVNHALAAKDYDGAARLVEQNINALMPLGQLATLRQWVEALPADVFGRHPLLATGAAWVLTFAGAIQRVEPLLQQAETCLAGEAETALAREVQGNVAAVRALLGMMTGDNQQAILMGQRAEALLPESSVQARSLLPYTLGSAYRAQGQYEPAAQAFARVVALGDAADDLLIWATGVTEIINTRHAQGRLREAVEVGRRALRRLDAQGAAQISSLAKIEVALCDVLRETAALDEARRRVAGAIERMQGWDMPTDQLFAYLTLTRVCRAQGDFAAAWESLRSAKDLGASHPILPFLARAVDLLEIRLCLATHDVAAAARLAEALALRASALSAAGESVPQREQELAMRARVRLAQGRLDDAASELDALARDAEAAGRVGTGLEIRALQALVLDRQGDREAALAVLLKALAVAEPEGFVCLFVDEGEDLQTLLAAAARQLAPATDPASIRLHAYCVRLLDAFPASLSPGAWPPPPRRATAASLVEPLTARELEVLRHIAAGDSNRAIADKLVISLSAVKKHTGNIFGKLSVNSRTQAIARARQLGLLPADE